MRASESQKETDTALAEIAWLSTQNPAQIFHRVLSQKLSRVTNEFTLGEFMLRARRTVQKYSTHLTEYAGFYAACGATQCRTK
jgi:hypothetical protein